MWKMAMVARRTTIAEDDNLLISLLSSLTVTFSFSIISYQGFCTWKSFSWKRLKLYSLESTITPANSKVNIGTR